MSITENRMRLTLKMDLIVISMALFFKPANVDQCSWIYKHYIVNYLLAQTIKIPLIDSAFIRGKLPQILH